MMNSMRGPRPQTVYPPGVFPQPPAPPSFGLVSQFAELKVQPPREEPRDPAVSDRRLEEFRRSLFVPSIPQGVSPDELAAVFRTFGNLQDYIVKDTGSHRYAIVIYVEPESAYDVLCSKIVVNDKTVLCEPRNINGRNYPPLVPMDVETPARIQTAPGSGRGVPFSVVADKLPVVPGSAYSYGDFPPLGAPGPRTNGPVATRAPVVNPRPQLIVGLAQLIQGMPIQLPMAQPTQPKTKPLPPTSTAMVLRRMPFLQLSSNGLEQMGLLVYHVELKDSELLARECVRQQLEQTFRRIFKNCRLRLYGSSANTFGVRGSDIDAFLDLNLDSEEARKDFPARQFAINYYSRNITKLQENPFEPGELKNFTKQEILYLMERLMRYLAKLHDWDYIHAIPEARTPILKLHQARSNMSVDISFSSKMVFQNTGLLILYSRMDPRIRPLVYTLRRWAEAKQLSGEGAFTKYALTMLLVFFLHHTKPAVLPPPEQIAMWMESEREQQQAGPSGDHAAGHAPFTFDMHPDVITHLAKALPPSLNRSSPDDLLMQFFNFYADFPFTTHVMCGYSGDVVPFEAFTVPEDGFRFRYVNLQDPFDLPHNIAKSVSMQTFTAFREFLRQEVTVFSRRPLNLVVLFDMDHVEPGLPDYPVMVPVAPSRNFRVQQDDWGLQVADLTGKILKELFFCEFVNEISDAEFSVFAFSRTIHKLGPVLRHLHCRLECQSWLRRRNVRKHLVKSLKPVKTVQDEWDNEVAIGEHLHKTTHKEVTFDFYVTVMINAVESEKACVFLTCSKKTDKIREFFDILWKFLPEQTRRYLKEEAPPKPIELPPPASDGMPVEAVDAVAVSPVSQETAAVSRPPRGGTDLGFRGPNGRKRFLN